MFIFDELCQLLLKDISNVTCLGYSCNPPRSKKAEKIFLSELDRAEVPSNGEHVHYYFVWRETPFTIYDISIQVVLLP